MRIVLDPGHGGPKSRGCKVGKLDEADYNLCFVNMLSRKFKDSGHACYRTRQKDSKVKFSERAQVAKAEKADLVLSIHVNANRDPFVGGIDLFSFEVNFPLVGMFRKCLPRIIEYPRMFNFQSAWTRRAYNVVKRYHCPAVLIELGYSTNPAELKLLESSAYKNLLANSIVSAVDLYELAGGNDGKGK